MPRPFNNPFSEAKRKYLEQLAEDIDWEDVDGPMQCQNCKEVVPEGRYSAELKVVTWKCSKGHTSKLENYVV